MASEENLLWYIEGNKLWHDNSEKLNTFLSYYKGNWYWHSYRARTENSDESDSSTDNNEENNNTENTNEEQEWNE
jgi:hypothetical protein